MSLAEAILKQHQLLTKKNTKRIAAKQQSNTNNKVLNTKEATKDTVFDYQILSCGGESVLVFKDKSGKKREVAISVHTPIITYPAKYKWHVRNAFGNRIFIKVQKRELAQEVVDYLMGEKGKYKVSASSVD